MATRVLFPFIGGDVLGGSHISSLKIAARLDPDRFEPLVVLHGGSGAIGDYAASLGLPYRVMDGPQLLAPSYSRTERNGSLFGYALRTLNPLTRMVRESGAAIVHTNDGRNHVNWALPARLAGARHLWHHRADPRAFGVNRLAPLLGCRVVGVSEFARPAAPIFPIGDRYSVVRSPFDTDIVVPDRTDARAALLEETGLPEGAVVLGYVGLLSDRKRPLAFVEAVASAVRLLAPVPVHGVMFGQVEVPETRLDARCMERAAALGIADHIHLLGHRSGMERPIRAMDALLVTAHSEPFGRTLIEAMCLGTPVVATRHGGNVEAIDDGRTGFLVAPDDPKAFARAVARLHSNTGLREALTARARQDAISRFSTQRSVEDISAVYDELLAERPGRLFVRGRARNSSRGLRSS